ncbi:unnamed protein product [Notodromas monacha]|uniref:Prefoldin subunit 3 n=1 Tax=Notodromas monacha TaxID=399045 RepID=A0A7R9BKB2_9CRUS|nr:unnamed protein product [Notodromas monacha]CAG0916812.1 unnamed protein product [Notodromas monacha]
MDPPPTRPEDPEKKSHAGIPEAEFVEDVDAYMNHPDHDRKSEDVLKQFDEMHSKYRFMELNLTQKKRKLRVQLPDLEKSLELVKKLKEESAKKSGNGLPAHFLISEQLFAKATIPPTKTVCLWLGANVMLEYTLEDAEALLTQNMTVAKKNLGIIQHDLDFLKDQITTTEVNMARVYNWDVKRRQAAKAAGDAIQ